MVDATGSRAADVLIQDGQHRRGRVADQLRAGAGTVVLDASGCIVAPGLVDLHTHLREPGREEAETVETGARAAALRWLHRRGGHAQHRARHRLRRRGP